MYFQILKNLRDIANDRQHDAKYTNILCMICCSSLYGIVTNELFMDSVFEDKQNRVLVMTRKGIYMYILYL